MLFSHRRYGPAHRAVLFPAMLLGLMGCGQPQTTSAEGAGAPRAPVVLEAAKADRQGAVQKKWDRWVVWCGHKICDGSYTWEFPTAGSYRFMWKDIVHKCAGASPYAMFIDGDKVVEGKIPRHGSCSGCTPQNIVHNPGERYLKRADFNLGSYRVQAKSKVKLWVQNAFDCGIQNPGAYGGHFLEIVAYPED
jgi:hypothetical protein